MAENSRVLRRRDVDAVHVTPKVQEIVARVEIILRLHVIEKSLRGIRVRLAREEQVLEFVDEVVWDAFRPVEESDFGNVNTPAVPLLLRRERAGIIHLEIHRVEWTHQ